MSILINVYKTYKSVLSNLFQAMGHFKNFHVAEGRIGRLLQPNPGLGTGEARPDHNALLQHSGSDLELFRLFSRTAGHV